MNRFFALHVVAVPLLLLALVFLHVIALHEVGSNNPDGVEIKRHKGSDGVPLDGIPFHPYYTVKDLFGVGVFMIIFLGVVFYAPELGGVFLEHDNFVPANPLLTPEHIKPVWYFTPFYAMLRAIPPVPLIDQFSGVFVMGTALLVLFFLPWIDRNDVKSIRYRSGAFKLILWMFVVSFVVLGWLGMQPAEGHLVLLARIFTVTYFLFFILLYFISGNERVKPVPDRVSA